jgi:hypothetical protein
VQRFTVTAKNANILLRKFNYIIIERLRVESRKIRELLGFIRILIIKKKTGFDTFFEMIRQIFLFSLLSTFN